MSYYELFQAGPTVYIPVLLLSLVLTFLVYGTFPIVFAKTRKDKITRRKYKFLCYLVNAIGILFFVIFYGAASGGPYLLWTWIFSNYGVKALDEKGLLYEIGDEENSVIDTNEEKEVIRFCRKCGAELGDNNNFCRKCGTKVIKE